MAGSHCSPVLCAAEEQHREISSSAPQLPEPKGKKSPLLTGVLHAGHGGGAQLDDTNCSSALLQGRHCQNRDLGGRKQSLRESRESCRVWQPPQSSLQLKRNCNYTIKNPNYCLDFVVYQDGTNTTLINTL